MSFICIVCRDLLTTSVEEPQGAAALPQRNGEADIVATKCGHLYHLHCLTGWLNTQPYGRVVNECPYCKTQIKGPMDYIKVFPSGDEETDDIQANTQAAKLQQGENTDLQDELRQVHAFLSAAENRLDDESLQHDILKFEYTQRISELDYIRLENDNLKESFGTADAANKLKQESQSTQIAELAAIIIKYGESELKYERELQRQQKDAAHKQILQNDTIQNLKEKLRELEKFKDTCDRKCGSDKSCQTEYQDIDELMTRLSFFDTCIQHMTKEKKYLEAAVNERTPLGVELTKPGHDVSVEYVESESDIGSETSEVNVSTDSSSNNLSSVELEDSLVTIANRKQDRNTVYFDFSSEDLDTDNDVVPGDASCEM